MLSSLTAIRTCISGKPTFRVVLTALSLSATTLASAAIRCVEPHGNYGCRLTINSAVSASSAGDTIVVLQGTYDEQIIITQPLSLVAAPFSQPVIEAKGKSNGIFINGVAASPKAGVANVVVTGFEVKDANFEGILVANASNVSLIDNHVHDNNKGLQLSSPATCLGIPPFETSEQSDCGEGIHLIGVDHSSLMRNLVENNSGGILITDETGPSTDNVIKGNVVRYNPYACGITMAGHPAANASGPIKALSYGLMHNVISHNESHHNGLGLPGAGAGVGIFAPGPGTTNTANVVIGNELYDNGLPGVTMHNHAFFPPPTPGVNFNDNVIVGNHIYGNAADTEDAFTPGPTGINISSAAPMTGTVIAQNQFSNEAVNIAFKAPSGLLDAHFNDFNDGGIGIDNLGAGFINGTENWWGCVTGPAASCSSVAGPGVSSLPWIYKPFGGTGDDF